MAPVPKPSGGLADFLVTAHAALEMTRRQISREELQSVVLAPQQWIEVTPSRVVLQSRFEPGDGTHGYLLRVVVDVDGRPPEIVTAYRTSKIEKYWSVRT